MIYSATFGQWLKQRRKALGLTQKDLAQHAGCAEITLRKIEAGELAPSAQLAASLARAVGATDADLPGILTAAYSASETFAHSAAQTLPRRPHNLPAQLTPLFGREHDIAAVRKRLLDDDARLVTLLGPPGVGKTRLALAVAEDVLEHFEHGAFLVRLAPIDDPAQVASGIAQALGLELSGPNPPELRLRAWLEEKHLFLVLDNFEHLVAAAPLVDDLLRRCPWLHVLVTSRQPLRVRGERQVTVRPLALPAQASGVAHLAAGDALRYSAVAMFAERAEAVLPDFAVTDANAAAVAALCRRLDGLPLAIELVAARVKLLPPAELLARLSGSWMLSSDGLRDVSTRQRTLRGAIGWSFDLLSSLEQTLFRYLSVFVGGFTLEAAELLCGDALSPPLPLALSSAQVLDGIASLLDKSLLHREAGLHGEPRYVMLETVREYALEQLIASQGETLMRDRHLAWCRSLATRAMPGPFTSLRFEMLSQFDLEIHNIRSALGWALTHDTAAAMQLAQVISAYLRYRSCELEAKTWVELALALPEAAAASEERASVLAEAGLAAFYLSDYAVAEVLLAEALAISRKLELPLGKARTLYGLGRCALETGNLAQAEAYFDGALAAYRVVSDPPYIGAVLFNLAEIALERGDIQHSRALYEEALAVAQPWPFLPLGALGHLALLEGNFARARELCEQSLSLCREAGLVYNISWQLACLAEVAIRERNFAIAHKNLDEAMTIRQAVGDAWEIAEVRACQGDLAMAEAAYDEALAAYRDSLLVPNPRAVGASRVAAPLRLARLAAAMNQFAIAATLLAACWAAVESRGEVLFPITRADFDQVLMATKAALDIAAFKRAWLAGHALTLHAAVAYGLQAII